MVLGTRVPAGDVFNARTDFGMTIERVLRARQPSRHVTKTPQGIFSHIVLAPRSPHASMAAGAVLDGLLHLPQRNGEIR